MFKKILLLTGLIMMSSCADQPDDAALQKLMNDTIKVGVPGVSVALADKEGIIWTGTAGKSDMITGAPVKIDHLFGIGSITKTFVAVVTLQLVEEGRLSLDQTALDILGADVVGKVPGADVATIAQLLNHTSGIPSWEDDPLWIEEGRGEALDVTRIWNRRDALPYIEKTPLTNTAGEKYSYANTNHTLIGLIIEKITGNDVVGEIRERILKPVGIKDIYLEGFQTIPTTRLATRYHYATAEFKRDAGIHSSFKPVPSLSPDLPALIDVSTSNLSVEWTAGGMVATAGDLAKYAAAYRAGKLLKPASMDIVQDWFPIKDTVKVGHGVFHIKSAEGLNFIGHTGSVLGYTGLMRWSEDHDLAIVVLANVGTMHIGQKLKSAASLGADIEFIKAALKYAKEKRK